jgi:hypothetical protein
MFDTLGNKERIVLVGSIVLVCSVLGGSIFKYVTLETKEVEVKVFDAYDFHPNVDHTMVLTYGQGKLKLEGEYWEELETDKTYHFVLRETRKRNLWKVIDFWEVQ